MDRTWHQGITFCFGNVRTNVWFAWDGHRDPIAKSSPDLGPNSVWCHPSAPQNRSLKSGWRRTAFIRATKRGLAPSKVGWRQIEFDGACVLKLAVPTAVASCMSLNTFLVSPYVPWCNVKRWCHVRIVAPKSWTYHCKWMAPSRSAWGTKLGLAPSKFVPTVQWRRSWMAPIEFHPTCKN